MNNKANKDLINLLNNLETEKTNPETVNIDTLSSLEITQKINAEDKKVAGIVEKALPQIARAAEIVAETLRNGGRLVYIGAGTSGRLGVLDASECPPTFGTDPKQIVGLISGGYETLVLSREGVEDRAEEAVKDLKRIDFSPKDFLVGIAASVRTPYTIAGLEYAISVGARTAFIVCNKAGFLTITPPIIIELPVGPEVITGSTRMKSGTAQKMVLNMITTTAMILLGKTYGNLMVDLRATSEKLTARSKKILIDLLNIDYDVADKLLKEAGGSVKIAMAMYLLKIDKDTAIARLSSADGFLNKILLKK
ncbi:MAG: N-acetylmuramic acid 6-phosphate etherase [Candidatus Zixiibacteriota bacterium]